MSRITSPDDRLVRAGALCDALREAMKKQGPLAYIETAMALVTTLDQITDGILTVYDDKRLRALQKTIKTQVQFLLTLIECAGTQDIKAANDYFRGLN